jgi:hypothetical protein
VAMPADPNPLTPADLRNLVKLVAGIDGHARSTDDVDVWALAATAGHWTRVQVAAAMLAIAPSFRGFRVQPGHIQEQIDAHRELIRSRWDPPAPPRHLAQDPDAEIAWRRAALADYRQRALTALAAGQPLDEVPAVVGDDQLPINPGVREQIQAFTQGSVGQIPAPDSAEVTARQERRDLLAAPCPYCGAQPTEPCTREGATGRVRLTKVHPSRAEQAA